MKRSVFKQEKEQNRTAVPIVQAELETSPSKQRSSVRVEVVRKFFLLPPFRSPPETKLGCLRSASTLPLRRLQRIALSPKYCHQRRSQFFFCSFSKYQHGGQFPHPRPLKPSPEPTALTTESTSSTSGPTLSTSESLGSSCSVTMSTPSASPDASSPPSTPRKYNLRNPLPLSASQEQEVKQLYYKRVRGYCASEIKGMYYCSFHSHACLVS